jgi:hypothetical protein
LKEEPPVSDSKTWLICALRGIGCLDLCALVAVVMPTGWMEVAHEALGMGTFPAAPVAAYLARTTSALYALHGATLVFVSFDVDRYAKLIRFLALATCVLGGVVLAIDLPLALPDWWRYGEGPCIAAGGVIVLALVRRANRGPLNPP